MKRIGIVTFHTAINYGVYLQCYALQERIKYFGYDAYIIDYRKRTDDAVTVNKSASFIKKIIENKKSIFKINKIFGYFKMKKIKKSNLYQKRIKKFHDFSNKYHQLTQYCESYEEVNSIGKDFDACVCGSDQIWNPLYTKCNPVFFLKFMPENKRIAYAPSIGTGDIPLEMRNEFAEAVAGMSFLSVREKDGADIIKELTGLNAKVVVDPTLLLHKNDWLKLISEDKEKEPYVLCYFLSRSNNHLKILNKLKSNTGLNVIQIPMAYEEYVSPTGKHCYASINEFITLFHNAEFILTDSFHGVVFSVIFNRNFYAIKRSDTGRGLHSRIDNFLKKLDLSERIVTDKNCDLIDITITNYSRANNILEEWRQESNDYLRDSLIAATHGEVNAQKSI